MRNSELLQEIIPRWYPQLIVRGADLRQQGVEFHDLTGVFQGVEEQVYKDACCHLNSLGNQLMGRVMGEIVVQHYASGTGTERSVDPTP